MGSGVFKAWREREGGRGGGRVAVTQSVFRSSHVE